MAQNPTGFELFLKIDDRQLKAQLKQWQDMFANAQKQFRQAIPPQAHQQARQISSLTSGGQSQVQQINKQMNLFQQMRDDIGKLSKNAIALAGIGAGVAGMLKLMLDASPVLHSTLRLLQTSLTLIFRPIADTIGLFIRPIIIELYRKIILPYNKFMSDLTPEVAAKIKEFYTDPSKVLAALATAIGGAVAISLSNKFLPTTSPPTTTTPGSGGGGGGGGPAGAAARCMELCNKTIDNINRGVSGALSESLRSLIPLLAGAGAGALLGETLGGNSEKIKEKSDKVVDDTQKLAESTQQMKTWIDFSSRTTSEIPDSVARMRQQFESSTRSAAEVAELNKLINERYQQVFGSSSQVAILNQAIEQNFRQSGQYSDSATQEYSNVKDHAQQSAQSTAQAKTEISKSNQDAMAIAAGVAVTWATIQTTVQQIVSKITGLASSIPGSFAFGFEHFGVPQEAFAEMAELAEQAQKSGSKINVEQIRQQFGDAVANLASQFANSSGGVDANAIRDAYEKFKSGGGSSSSGSKSSGKGGSRTDKTVRDTIDKLKKKGTPSPIGYFAEGGTILEPALLFGLRTGGVGIMSEKEPETIVNRRQINDAFKMPPTRPVEIHIHIGSISKDVDLQKLINAVKRALQQGNTRGGKI